MKNFIESNNHFEVVHSTSTSAKNFKRVLILDSSFNPPHLGHYSIIEKALKHPGFESSIVLLLLSVKNADKVIPKPASFEDRLNMMCLLSNYISKNLKVKVHVGLTKHAKFVDKSSSIRNHFLSDKIFTFLLGFDTLIRIFDNKYYKPISIKDSLNDFMLNNELFCLTRLNDEEYSVEMQLKFVEDIKNGLKEPDIPKNWNNSIYLINADSETLKISSSEIRNNIAINNSNWRNNVIVDIENYIIDHNIYHTESKI